MDNTGKIIFHIDVNSAFLSWSAVKILKDDPDAVDLRTIPSAVGGDVESRHGIITAKSIPAKKYGIVTGEPIVKAMQKCPNLVMVHGDFKTYREYSGKFIEILRTYSDKVEQVSIDEAFVDMTKPVMDLYETGSIISKTDTDNLGIDKKRFCKGDKEISNKEVLNKEVINKKGLNKEILNKEILKETAIKIAERIKDEIKISLGFTVNVGISSNKLLAKMASDFEKPDKVHTLFTDEISKKMWPLPIGDLFGCGKQTSARLSELGMRTIGAVAKTDLSILQDILGIKQGSYIYQSCHGIGSSEVNPYAEDAKSYSNETTTRSDITFDNYEKEMPQVLRWLSESVSRRLQRDGVFASTVSVSVKTDTFQRRSKQMGIGDSTSDEDIIYQTALKLMKELALGENGILAQGYSIRLVGVGAADLDKGEFRQMSLFDMNIQEGGTAPKGTKDSQRADKQRKLREMTKNIEAKFGEGAIRKGRDSYNHK